MATSRGSHKTDSAPRAKAVTGNKTLHDMFVHELRDMYNAEQQIAKALPKLIEASSSDELRGAFENHLGETERHISRLERAFDCLSMAPRGVRCAGMAGILEEGTETLRDAPDGAALDAAIIGSAQRVEHYEIAVYGTLVEWAKAMGHTEIVSLLDDNLREEKAADEILTRIAGSGINETAARHAHAHA